MGRHIGPKGEIDMFKNLAAWDRGLRLAAGAAIFSLMFWGPKSAWGGLGAILMATAAIGHCPIYAILGINTCPRAPGKRT
jgi:hypothetical protein